MRSGWGPLLSAKRAGFYFRGKDLLTIAYFGSWYVRLPDKKGWHLLEGSEWRLLNEDEAQDLADETYPLEAK